jgi:hypothetical protein
LGHLRLNLWFHTTLPFAFICNTCPYFPPTSTEPCLKFAGNTLMRGRTGPRSFP